MSIMYSEKSSLANCFDLFLISCTVLFVELAAIRWFPAYVISLTFFTNVVLIAAFVGMSIGCLAAERKWSVLDYLPSLMAVTCAAAVAIYISMGFMWLATVAVGDSQNPDLVYFGTERIGAAATKQAVPVEIVLGSFFVLIALWFVGLGQVLGRKLAAVENRILAYTVNIGGSLVGIVVFAAFSHFELPPIWWFVVAIVCVIYFLRETGQVSVPNLTLIAGTLLIIGILGWRLPGHGFYWSPYYAVRYSPRDLEITVNGIGHQRMLPSQSTAMYSLPYLLRRDAGIPPAKDVLIIGSGSGNDVAHALAHGVEHVDAVEIDPVIARLGRQDHPDRPYDDPRVRLIVNDGRAYLRGTDRQYDLIVYALVDSLTLHSSFSSIRLENFLFTLEAMADVRRHLKPGGMFVAYNFYRQGWIVTRLHHLMRENFGDEPLVLSLPPRDEIRDTESEGTHMAVLIAGREESLQPLRDRMSRSGGYQFFMRDLARQMRSNGFEAAADPTGRHDDASAVESNATNTPSISMDAPDAARLVPAQIVESRTWKLPTDDWPFLYLRDPRIPSHNWRGLAILGGLSLGLLLIFSPKRSLQINPHFFFLGAGFMLIETKSVTQMAQLFGSTWQVNSVVFAGILLMILLANLFVLFAKPGNLLPYYAGLGLALLVSWLVPLDRFIGHAVALRILESVGVLFLPIFFAGVIFATSFRRTADPSLAFGANIAGVVLGGLLEYLSLVVGYQGLQFVAAGLYLLSLFGVKQVALTSGPR
jgi:SAM-dependent methyltransferase